MLRSFDFGERASACQRGRIWYHQDNLSASRVSVMKLKLKLACHCRQSDEMMRFMQYVVSHTDECGGLRNMC